MTIKEYQKDLNKNVSDFLTELQKKFPDTVVTSGFRPRAFTKQGNVSRHAKREAVDIAPTEEIHNYLWNTKEGISLLNKYGLGILDETTPEALKKTGGTGKHYHIGMDSTLVPKAQKRYKELFGYDYGKEPAQEQHKENLVYELPKQDTTVVTNLPNSDKSFNFAQELDKTSQESDSTAQSEDMNQTIADLYDNQEEQIVEEDVVQNEPQINYQDIFNQVSQFVDSPIAQQGRIIDDNMGQWRYPGEITRISSSNITMDNVPYSVLGIADTGEVKIMTPNNNYNFDGAKTVTEYPIVNEAQKQYLKRLRNG